MGQQPRQKLRRCVVCRKSADKSVLLRFVGSDGRIVWDEHCRLPGRGAYIHSTLACWSKMSVPGMWEHALLMTKGSLPKDSVVEAARCARAAIKGAPAAAAASKVRL